MGLSVSQLGQKAKYSLRAHIVRFAPESGLKSDIAEVRKVPTPDLSASSVWQLADVA